MSDWITALREVESVAVDAVPKGFKTRAQIQKELGISQCSVWKLLTKLELASRVDIRKFRIVNGSAGIRPVIHYRLK